MSSGSLDLRLRELVWPCESEFCDDMNAESSFDGSEVSLSVGSELSPPSEDWRESNMECSARVSADGRKHSVMTNNPMECSARVSATCHGESEDTC